MDYDEDELGKIVDKLEEKMDNHTEVSINVAVEQIQVNMFEGEELNSTKSWIELKTTRSWLKLDVKVVGLELGVGFKTIDLVDTLI